MDAEDRKQLELLSERALKRGQDDFEQKVRQMYAEHSAKGVLGSGSTIKAGVRLMGEVGSRTLEVLVEQCSPVSRSEEALVLIGETIGKLLDAFKIRMLDLIDKATRMNPSASITSAAFDLFREMRSDLETDLLLARHGYLRRADEEPAQSRSARLKPNAGGKPLAEHWDAMWAGIAVQLWTGVLQPKRQADVKKAMFDWLNANEIEVGDTVVTQRARQLWQAMQDAES